MNTTEWKTLTPDAFPQNKEDVYETYANGRWTEENINTYRSKDAYIIAMDKDHMPKSCAWYWRPSPLDYDGKYIIRMFYAEHRMWEDFETYDIIHEEKAFYSPDGMVIPIDDKDMKYCKYLKVNTTSTLE